jgi:hypothetical protein
MSQIYYHTSFEVTVFSGDPAASYQKFLRPCCFYIYLFICRLRNDTVSSSDYAASSDSMISE